MEHITLEIGLVIISSAVVGVILYYLKQPLILAYILAGILLGPFGFGLINDAEFIHGVATIGIMLMLFLVGLEMNTSRLKELSSVALIVGIGQVIFTGSIGFLLTQLFGFTVIQGLYLAVALSFSSTVIAVKLIADKKDNNAHYAQICIGVLIVQDVLAILALLLLSGFSEGSFNFDAVRFFGIFVKGVALAILTLYVSKKVLSNIYSTIATSHELLVLFSISWCFIISGISMLIGFSVEIGAFIAGLSLANLPYTFEINTKTKVLRDFFITIFFAALGMGMVFSSIGPFLVPLIILSLFVLIGNPLIVLTIMGFMGYDKRTALFAGLSISNISEFSLIVIALGSSLGHIDDRITSMTAILAMITMVISSYMLTYNSVIYRKIKKVLEKVKFREVENTKKKIEPLSEHIILLGCGQTGEQVLSQVLSFKDDYIVVDFDNHKIKELIKRDVNCLFGDVDNEDLLEELNLKEAELIISTLPSIQNNFFLLKYIAENCKDKKPIVIAIADSGREGIELFNRGVDYVVLKPYLGAEHIHHINRDIYDIKQELDHISISKSTVFGKHSEDHNIAKLLHNLNKLRLKEIKHKIRDRGKPLKRKA